MWSHSVTSATTERCIAHRVSSSSRQDPSFSTLVVGEWLYLDPLHRWLDLHALLVHREHDCCQAGHGMPCAEHLLHGVVVQEGDVAEAPGPPGVVNVHHQNVLHAAKALEERAEHGFVHGGWQALYKKFLICKLAIGKCLQHSQVLGSAARSCNARL